MASGRPGGLGFLAGLFGLTATFTKGFVSSVSEQAETQNYLSSGGYNIERQQQLEQWARSRDPVEHRKFEEVYGRPVYRGYVDGFYHDAIYYIADKEGWRYCEPEDYTGNQKPVWFNGSKSEWAVKRGVLRADKYLKLMPRLNQYFEWYNKYKDGTPYYTGIFPEEYETEEGYRRALERKYPDMKKRADAARRYSLAEEKIKQGKGVNPIAVELFEQLNTSENYEQYIDILWRHFISRCPTKNQIAAKVYAWVLLNYNSIPEKNSMMKALKQKVEQEHLKDLETTYKKSVSERIVYFKKYHGFEDDETCAIGIDCMDLAWEYNTTGEEETLWFIKKKLIKIIGEKYVNNIMRKKFENKEFPNLSLIEIYKIC